MNTADADVMNVAKSVSVRWRPGFEGDHRRLTFLERADGADTVFDYRVDIGASEQVARFDERISGRFGQFDWNRDGTKLAYTRDGQIRLRDVDTDTETAPALSEAFDAQPRFDPTDDRLAFLSGRNGEIDIWMCNADGSALTQLTDGANPSDERRWAPSWGPHGDQIAYVAAHDWNGRDWADEVHLLTVDSEHDVRLTRGLTVTSVPAFGPDGHRLAFMAKRVAEPWYRHAEDIHVIDLRDESHDVYSVDASHQYNVQQLQWEPAGRKLYYPVRTRGSQQLAALAVDTETGVEGVQTQLTQHEGVIGVGGAGEARLSPDGKQIGFPFSAHHGPAHPQSCPTAGGPPETLRDPNAPDGVVVPEQVAFEAADGLYINGYLYLPPEASASEPVPALVQAHGGAHFQYNDGWHPLEQYLVANGYAVLAVDFRGSGGYGRSFQELSMGDWEGGEVRDLRDSAAFMRERPETTDSVGIYGGSWGGYMTLHSIAQYPDTWDAAVEWYGVVNQFSDHAESDRVGRLLTERDLGGGPTEKESAYYDASVHWRLDDVSTPLAVLHGAEDKRVPINQAEELDERFRDAALPFDLTVYQNEGHGFRDAANRRDAVKTTIGWFDQHLG